MIHPTPYAAHLRVYEPREVLAAGFTGLDGQPEGQQEGQQEGQHEGVAARPESRGTARGKAGAHGGTGAARHARAGRDTRAAESILALTAAVATPPVVVPDHETAQAHELEVDGRVYVCPWQTRLRSWQAVEELRRELPDPVLRLLLSPAVAARLRAEEDRWREVHREQVAHIQTATWHVPPRWFMLFDPGDRQLVASGETRSVVYRTPISSARRRGALALRAVRRGFGDGPVVDDVERLGRWLEEFHPRSLVELDYGGLPLLMSDEQLTADTSVADVAEALGHLADGDSEQAARGYERLMARWREVQAFEHAN